MALILKITANYPTYKEIRSAVLLFIQGSSIRKRNPRLFLNAVHQLIEEGKISQSSVELKFAGVFDYPGYTENMDCVRELGLEDIVKVLGHLPHQQALVELKKSDILLLVGDTAPGFGRLYTWEAIRIYGDC